MLLYSLEFGFKLYKDCIHSLNKVIIKSDNVDNQKLELFYFTGHYKFLNIFISMYFFVIKTLVKTNIGANRQFLIFTNLEVTCFPFKLQRKQKPRQTVKRAY